MAIPVINKNQFAQFLDEAIQALATYPRDRGSPNNFWHTNQNKVQAAIIKLNALKNTTDFRGANGNDPVQKLQMEALAILIPLYVNSLGSNTLDLAKNPKSIYSLISEPIIKLMGIHSDYQQKLTQTPKLQVTDSSNPRAPLTKIVTETNEIAMLLMKDYINKIGLPVVNQFKQQQAEHLKQQESLMRQFKSKEDNQGASKVPPYVDPTLKKL